jgi:hypothetical protein
MPQEAESTTAVPIRNNAGFVAGSVRLWLRMESSTVLAVAIFFYIRGGYSWLLFVLLFLAPDLTFFAYAMGPRIGAAAYNALHSYIGPLVLACGLSLAGHSLAVPLIWIAHIGLDRLLGYGLKYPTGFGDTHLGKLGRRAVETGIQ